MPPQITQWRVLFLIRASSMQANPITRRWRGRWVRRLREVIRQTWVPPSSLVWHPGVPLEILVHPCRPCGLEWVLRGAPCGPPRSPTSPQASPTNKTRCPPSPISFFSHLSSACHLAPRTCLASLRSCFPTQTQSTCVFQPLPHTQLNATQLNSTTTQYHRPSLSIPSLTLRSQSYSPETNPLCLLITVSTLIAHHNFRPGFRILTLTSTVLLCRKLFAHTIKR